MPKLRFTSACILFAIVLTYAPAWFGRLVSRSNHAAAQGQPVPATIIRTIVYRQVSSFQSGSGPNIERMKMSADGSKVIFSNSAKKIFTINTDGTGFTQVFDYATFRGGCPCGGVFVDISANGSKIIWSDNVDEIFIANGDGSNRQRIATAIPSASGGANGLNLAGYSPRITADGSRVYFHHLGDTIDTEGVYVIDANGANLRKLFSYRQISAVFGLNGSEAACGGTRFTGNLDISDNGARLVFGTGCTRFPEGDALTFDGTTLRSLTSATGRVAGNNTSRLAISGDGSKVAALRVVGNEERVVFALNFDGSSQAKLLGNTSFNGLRFGGLTTNGAQVLASTDNYPLPLLNTDGSGRVDLIIPIDCDIAPDFPLSGGSSGASSLSADGRRFAFRTTVPGAPQQLWIADINPTSTGDAPRITEVTFNPSYVTADGSTTSTFTARATDAQGGQSGLRRRACGNTLRNGAYEFRYLVGGAAFGIALFDNGTSGGDQTANDGLFTQTQVRRDLAPPDPITPLQIRHHAIATSLRQITAVDATPFFVLAQAPAGSGPTITSINPSSGAAGIQVKITGSNFDPVAANNVVLFGTRQASVVSATADGTMLEVIVPPDLPAGTVAVTVTVRAQTSNAVNFTVTGPAPTPTPTPTPCTSTTELKVDDGTLEFSVGYRDGASNASFVNRLTPSGYPATLQSISIFFTNSPDALPIGSSITILAAANPSGSSTLTTPAYQTTAATINTANAFNRYDVPPLTITSGDFVAGFRVDVPPGIYPAMLDNNSPSQMRSYFATGAFNLRLLDSISGLAGNFMIRAQLQGSGTNCCPTISNVSPASGAPGASVTINGSNLTGVTAVKFANNVAAQFTVVSDTQITATVPNGAATGPLIISKPNCPDAQSPAPFTVTTQPTPTPTPPPGTCIAVSIPTNLTGSPNSTLTVPVNASDTTGRNALSYDAVLTFNPSALRLQNPPFDRAGTLSANLTITTNSPVAGRVNISGFSSAPLVGAGVLLNLKFDVIGSLNACSDLNWMSFRFNEGTPCSTTANGRACATGGGSIAGLVSYCAASPPKPVPGASVTAAGAPPASATTDAAGNYQLPNLGGGPYTLTPAKTGDANGITSFDAAQIAQHVVQIITLSSCQQAAADTSGNGEITSFDAAFIAQFVVGITNPANTTGTWKFLPPTRTYGTLSGAQTAQNFDAVLAGELTGNWTPGGSGFAVNAPTQTRLSPAAGPTQIAVALPQTTGAPDSTVTVPITVGDLTGRGFLSFDFDLTYDANVLQAQQQPADSTDTLSRNLTITANATPGRLRVSGFSAQAMAGAGTLLKLKFNVTGASGTGTALTWQRFLFNETAQTSLTNGRVNAANAVASVSAASFLGQSLASESIVAAFGTAMATRIEVASTLPLPTSIAGTTVKVRDSAGTERLASLFFVAPTQINFQIPPGTVSGQATVTVTSGDGTASTGSVTVAAVAPGLFSANASGQGVPAATVLRVKADGSQSFEPVARFDTAQNQFVTTPIDLGPDLGNASDQLFLILFGTGWRFRSALPAVTCGIGGANAEVLFAGAQGGFVGLDQMNVRLARSLAGRGEIDVALTVDGKTANTVRINVK